jgi:hypothetical protein
MRALAPTRPVSNQSGVSGPSPAPPGPRTVVAAASGRGDRVLNGAYNPQYAPFKALGIRVADVRERAQEAGKPVPQNSRGVEFCLSYHVLGFCWNNCGKAGDHQAHNAADSSALLAWCGACYREGGPSQ